jgi:uncharacterized glyoxalase superfamily protein PhnB
MPEAPRLFPSFHCRDAEAMIGWLCTHLGFRERAVYRDGGKVRHAELMLGSSILMLGDAREDAIGALVGSLDGRRTDGLYVVVDEPDALHDRLVGAGTRIEVAPRDTDYGSRDFAFRDPEGNLWWVGTYWPKAEEPPLT